MRYLYMDKIGNKLKITYTTLIVKIGVKLNFSY